MKLQVEFWQSSRSKKDRKEQKSNFRDYVKTVEDGETYYEKMVINRREVLEIESWSQKKQYDAMCKVSDNLWFIIVVRTDLTILSKENEK